MQYEFDKVIDRGPDSQSFSVKWQGYQAKFPGYDIDIPNTLSMWVADMDFPCLPEVVDAMVERAKHGIYGYSSEDSNQAFREAAVGWFERHYHWQAQPQWMLFASGVIPAFNCAIQELTQEGDGVIIQEPVYYPFALGVRNNHRKVVSNQLIYSEGRYEIDFADLEEKAQDPNTKLLILSSPHNPVGRVWTQDEVEKMCEICARNQVYVFADEIHADLIFSNATFFSCGNLPQYYPYLMLAHSASKTFNVAGLSAALITIPDDDLRQRIDGRMQMNRYPGSNVFGPIAGAAAYTHGDQYVAQLVDYIEGNVAYVATYFETHIPKVKMIQPEGTYLIWFDFNGTGLTPSEIYHKVLEEAKVAGDLGVWFGGDGSDGFVRFNLATPRANIEEFVQRIQRVFGDA